MAQFVANYKRIVNPKLPFFLQDESEGEYKEIMAEARQGKGKRRVSKSAEAAFDKSRTEAKRMRKDAEKNVAMKVAANKKYYDKAAKVHASLLKPGDVVAIRQSSFTARMHGRLAFQYKGPYTIIRIKDRGVTYVDDDGKKITADIDNCKPYRQRGSSETCYKI